MNEGLEVGRSNITRTLPHQTRTRGLPTYLKALPGLSKVLTELFDRVDAHWMDGGAGLHGAAVLGFLEYGTSAFAQPEYQQGQVIEPERNPPRSLTVTLVDLDCQAVPNERVRVLSGRLIEQIPQDDLPRCDLITEVEGPFSYSARPDLVLGRYLSSLKAEGVLFLGLGSSLNLCMPGRDSRVACGDGQVRSYLDWLQTLRGILVVPHRYLSPDPDDRLETICVEVRKKPGEDFEIPELEILRFKAGGPPASLLRETRCTSDATHDHLHGLIEAERRSREAFAATAERLGPGDFLDNFRSGPLDARVVRAASHPGGWCHAGVLNQETLRALRAGELGASTRYPFAMKLQQLGRELRPLDLRVFRSPDDLRGTKGLGLITDLGVFAASMSPDLVLREWLQALADDGELFIGFGSQRSGVGEDSRVLTRKGKDLSLAHWLKSIPGLDVELHVQRGPSAAADELHARVRINRRAEIYLRRLETLGATARRDGPCGFLFREDLLEPPPDQTLNDTLSALASKAWEAMW